MSLWRPWVPLRLLPHAVREWALLIPVYNANVFVPTLCTRPSYICIWYWLWRLSIVFNHLNHKEFPLLRISDDYTGSVISTIGSFIIIIISTRHFTCYYHYHSQSHHHHVSVFSPSYILNGNVCSDALQGLVPGTC